MSFLGGHPHGIRRHQVARRELHSVPGSRRSLPCTGGTSHPLEELGSMRRKSSQVQSLRRFRKDQCIHARKQAGIQAGSPYHTLSWQPFGWRRSILEPKRKIFTSAQGSAADAALKKKSSSTPNSIRVPRKYKSKAGCSYLKRKCLICNNWSAHARTISSCKRQNVHIVVNTDFVEIKEGNGCQAYIIPSRTNVSKSKLYFINEKVKVVQIWKVICLQWDFLICLSSWCSQLFPAQSDPNLQFTNSQGELLLDCSSKYLENLVEKFTQSRLIEFKGNVYTE